MTPVTLTSALIEKFGGTFLSHKYDNRAPTPPFHRSAWALYASSHPQCMVVAPREHAKAQPLSSMLLTPTGWRRLADLVEGNYVIGGDGKPTRIAQLHPISELALYKVTLADGRSTRCNEEHLWPIIMPQNTGSSVRIRALKDIIPKAFKTRYDPRFGTYFNDYRCFVPVPPPIEFSPIDDDSYIDGYVLGIWLGDGHSADGRITSADPEIFDYFPESYKVSKRSGLYLYKVNMLRAQLKGMEVLGNKRIPSQYFRAPVAVRLALLQGLMDTDGTIQKKGWNAYFCNTNEELLADFVALVRSLGGTANKFYGEQTVKDAPYAYWRVSVGMPEGMCPFRLKRKADKWQAKKALKLAITSIEPCGKELSRCITVENSDGLYITDEYTLTHNSTGLNFVYGLAELLFRTSDYCILASSTEDLAAEQLGNISEELHENEELRRYFGVKGFESEAKADMICVMQDGHRFRVLCRGAEQRIRGRLWKNKRPNLFLGDDLEDDEQVENPDRRMKFRRWFFRAAKQALGRYGKARVHGTILHDDSLLSRLAKCPKCKNLQWNGMIPCQKCGTVKVWQHLYYKAHESFDDFSNILWPEQWPEERLRARRQEFIEDGDAAGYSQEFLNDPLDNSDAYLKRADFLPMNADDYDSPKIICAAADFAVSKADRANRTSFIIGGKDVNNLLHFIDQRVDRWDPSEWLEVMFQIQQRWNPEVFWVEDGVIWSGIKGMIYREMQIRDIRINIEARTPIKDKGTRGRSFQRRMRAGQCRFDKKAEWYPGYEMELIRFTGNAAATLDDQFDSSALLSLGFDTFQHVEKEDFWSDEDRKMEQGFWIRKASLPSSGRSKVTGY